MLVKAGYVKNIKAVVKGTDNKYADKRAHDTAFAAGKACAAENYCRNGVKFITGACGGCAELRREVKIAPASAQNRPVIA